MSPRLSSPKNYFQVSTQQQKGKQQLRGSIWKRIFIFSIILLSIIAIFTLIIVLSIRNKTPDNSPNQNYEEKERGGCDSTCVTSFNNTKILSDPLPSSWPFLKEEWMKSKGLSPNQVILQTKGCILEDGNGNPVILKGVSMTGLEWSPPTLIGVTEESFLNMKRWGANVVRVPFRYDFIVNADGSNIMETNKCVVGCLDGIIEKAMQHGMYVILDNHNIEGNINRWGYNALLALLRRYQDYGMVMYEIFNEPKTSKELGCQSYFLDTYCDPEIPTQLCLSVVSVITNLRKAVVVSPILILSGLNYNFTWAFMNPDLVNDQGKPFCDYSIQTLLSAGSSFSSSSPNIMLSVHPYSRMNALQQFYLSDTCIAIPSSSPNPTELTLKTNEIIQNLPGNGITIEVKVPNLYNGMTNQEVYEWKWTNSLNLKTYQEVNGCKTLLYSSSELENLSSRMETSFGWLVTKNIAPLIFTEFGNLEVISFLVNQQFTDIILQYVNSKNKTRKGSCHYTAWAWIDNIMSYQSLLQDCINFQPLLHQTSKDPVMIPCGNYPSYAQQVYNDLSTSGI